jgi:hypothetical protein
MLPPQSFYYVWFKSSWGRLKPAGRHLRFLIISSKFVKTESMYADSRKIHIIEAVLRVEDEKILSQIEQVIEKSQANGKKFSAQEFVGILSKEDALSMDKAIAEGCEQIHPDDWK